MSGEKQPSRTLASVVDPAVRTATAADRERLSEFLTGLAPDTAYQRFMTGMSGRPSPLLLAALLPEPPAGGALLGFIGDELVGHGLWARLADPAAAEIAIVVADRHQRRGIGTALARAVTEDLAAHGVREVQVFSNSDNRAVARMVSRRADARRSLDGPTATYTFAAPSRVASLPDSA